MTDPTEQVQGVHHRRFGDVVVTALLDGWLQLPAELYIGCDPAEAARLSALAFGPPVPFSAINALLVRTGGKTVLIDTGSGGTMGIPHEGLLATNLRAAGVAPDEIDMVLLTHLHSDHFGGAVDASGQAVFARAELVYPEADAAHFLAQDPAASAGQRRVLDAYAGRARALEDGGLPPGLTPRPLPGHTPGHTGYLIGEQLLHWGDIFHLPALQVRRPEIGVKFDVDPAAAEQTRRAVLDTVAAERLMVNGGHMDFPGFAHIERAADAGFGLVWSTWAPEL